MASSFINGANERAGALSTLMSTFYAGAPLAYPFMPDFFIAVLVAGGMDWHGALSATGGVLLSSLTALAYMLNYRVGGSQRAAAISLFLAVCTGGLGGFYYAQATPGWWTPANLTSQAFIHGPDHVLYWAGGRGAGWFAMCAHILFPQRTVQHAYPLALAALLLVWVGVTGMREAAATAAAATAAPVVVDANGGGEASSSTGVGATGGAARRRGVGGRPGAPQLLPGDAATATEGDADARKPSGPAAPSPLFSRATQLRVFAAAGLVTGLLPLMQPHSFVSVGVIVLVVAAGRMAERVITAVACGASQQSLAARWAPVVDATLEWLAYGIVALGVGVPQLLKHFAHRIGGMADRGGRNVGFVRFSTAWAEEGKGKGPLDTWWEASGIFLPLFLASLLLVRKREQAYFFVGLAAMFLVAHYIMFQVRGARPRRHAGTRIHSQMSPVTVSTERSPSFFTHLLPRSSTRAPTSPHCRHSHSPGTGTTPSVCASSSSPWRASRRACWMRC